MDTPVLLENIITHFLIDYNKLICIKVHFSAQKISTLSDAYFIYFYSVIVTNSTSFSFIMSSSKKIMSVSLPIFSSSIAGVEIP